MEHYRKEFPIAPTITPIISTELEPTAAEGLPRTAPISTGIGDVLGIQVDYPPLPVWAEAAQYDPVAAKKDTPAPHKQGAPIIPQSPTTKAGGRTFVILPSGVAYVSGRRAHRSRKHR